MRRPSEVVPHLFFVCQPRLAPPSPSQQQRHLPPHPQPTVSPHPACALGPCLLSPGGSEGFHVMIVFVAVPRGCGSASRTEPEVEPEAAMPAPAAR